MDGEGVCFSGPALTLLGGIWVVLQGALVFLFMGWINSQKDSIREARELRDRALDGWETTVGLGETVARRERRRT